MKQAITINLAGRSFFIDTDAYDSLKNYMDRLESWFRGKEGGSEIIKDIEDRLSEIFANQFSSETGVITLLMVQNAIKTMGEPEEIDGEEPAPTATTWRKTSKKLYRDNDSRVFGGVCSGLSAYFNIDVVWIRVLFAFISLGGAGSGILAYFIFWIVVPAATTTSQKLEMKGENVTIINIEKTIRNEFEGVKDSFKNMKNSETYKNTKNFWDRFSKRDQTILIVVGVIVFIMLMNGFAHFPFIHFNSTMVHGMHGIMRGWFPMGLFFPLMIILLILGLVLKNRGLVIAGVVIFGVGIIIRFLFWMVAAMSYSGTFM